jgi:4a-hydroxytetrahydrobiopterin dehydratase
MKPSSATKPPSRLKARNAALLNQLATPGLGSLFAGRILAGLGQLLLSTSGFILIMIWFVQLMIQFYGQISGEVNVHSVGQYGVAGGVLFILAWCWSLATSFSLLRAASKASLESLESFTAGQIKMEEVSILLWLNSLPEWKRHDQIISRTFQFKNFPAAIKFVNIVADLAEQAQHHPDVDIRWNKVTLALTTHDAGGLTEKDFALARQFDAQSAK